MTLRENHVAIMLGDDELRLIDDYRFANRIPTRAKAMRGLIEQGLNGADMLEALHQCLGALKALGAEEGYVSEAARAAISKAEGR